MQLNFIYSPPCARMRLGVSESRQSMRQIHILVRKKYEGGENLVQVTQI